VLLVGHGRNHNVSRKPQSVRLATHDECGRKTRLHVIGAAAVEPVAVDPRREGLNDAVKANRVGVTAEQQRPTATYAT
jgi:hypothetical protein